MVSKRPKVKLQVGDRQGVYPLAGVSYRYQKKGVTEFDGWKLLKIKGQGKRVKFEAIRKLLKIGGAERYRTTRRKRAAGEHWWQTCLNRRKHNTIK
jgi:hypothetical protein